MAGIFPQAIDGAARANADTPNSPPQAYIEQWVKPADTSALYFSGACNLRLRPSVINSLISEIHSTADRALVPYQAASLQNLETSIRYLIQRGLPRAELLIGVSANNFDVTLDPPATHYSNYMTLTLVPQMAGGATQNSGYVRINANGLGYVPLLRNDGEELRGYDLLAYKPFICVYFSGAFYMVGLVASQVPLILVGVINFWIRPDGNDQTGDGTANTPERAFRTINGCWAAVGSRYAGSPSAHIAMRLGVPGSYAAGNVGPFGATLSITGDVNNPAPYRIMSSNQASPNESIALGVHQVNSMLLRGVNLVNTNTVSKPNGSYCLWSTTSQTTFDRSILSTEVSNRELTMAYCCWGGYLITGITLPSAPYPYEQPYLTIEGHGHTIGVVFGVTVNCSYAGLGIAPRPRIIYCRNFACDQAALSASFGSGLYFADHTFQNSNTSGPRYSVVNNSAIQMYGNATPGSTGGTIGPFSSFYP